MKSYLPLLILTVLSLILMEVLYISSKPIILKSGFKRNLSNEQLKAINHINLKYTGYYLLNLSAKGIVLGNYSAPLYTLNCSYDLKDTITVRLPFKYRSNLDWNAVKLESDSAKIHLVDVKTPAYISANLPFSNEKYLKLEGHRIDLFKMISANSMAIRYTSPAVKQKVLQKLQLFPKIKKEQVFIPKNHMDGEFSLDGFFIRNKARILYTFYYINKFLCLDTNMNLLYSASTIDTNKTAKIKVTEILTSKSKEKLMAAPALLVNKKGYSDGDWVYINSGIVSDNEDETAFEHYSVIDVYTINNGKYHHSFFVPAYQGKRMTDFAIWKNIIVVLYPQHLISYRRFP